MHGYKSVSPHNHPGLRSENARKQKSRPWSSRQQSADSADRNKMAADWKPESIKFLPDNKKQIERRHLQDYEIRPYSK